MGSQRVLDLTRRDVLTAGDHDVLRPVDDVDQTVIVDGGDVAGVQPAAVDRTGRGLGVVQVAGAHLAARDEQLAGPARGHVVRRLVDDPNGNARAGIPGGMQEAPLAAEAATVVGW